MKMQVYKPLWEFVPLNQYRKPIAPKREKVRNGISSFWKQFLTETYSTRLNRRQLGSIPPFLLNRAAPSPDLEQIINALGTALKGWFSNQESQGEIKVVIGAPGSYLDEVVTNFARQNGWQIIGTPSTQEILSGGDKWLENFTKDEMIPLVIPRLGKCFLRHQEGLHLLSRLLDGLQITKRRCLLACDSWAWAYLSKVIQIDVMLPHPLSLAPLDGARLQFWLPTLSSRDNGRFEFRNVLNGQALFPTLDNLADEIQNNARPGQMEWYGDWVGVSHYFKQLASYSRGLPQVVWHLWRQSLQMMRDENTQRIANGRKASKRYTVWVQPWTKLELPIMPRDAQTEEAMVLHTLLLHGGAPFNLIEFLLPLSYDQVRRILHNLLVHGFVEKKASGDWQISLLAYPAVRKFMKDEGYMVDEF